MGPTVLICPLVQRSSTLRTRRPAPRPWLSASYASALVPVPTNLRTIHLCSLLPAGILLALRSSSNFRNFETGHNSGRTLKNRCILTHAGSPALHFPFSEAGAVVPLPCEHHQSSLRSQTASNELTEIVAGRLDRCILSKVHEERSLGYRRGAAKEKSCDEGLSRGPGDVVPPWSFFAQTPFWISTLLNS